MLQPQCFLHFVGTYHTTACMGFWGVWLDRSVGLKAGTGGYRSGNDRLKPDAVILYKPMEQNRQLASELS
jgi:hypothetical protein